MTQYDPLYLLKKQVDCKREKTDESNMFMFVIVSGSVGNPESSSVQFLGLSLSTRVWFKNLKMEKN